MIAGIGIDVVDIDRFARSLERTPELVERLFAESERGRPARSLAARFAAKEALIKALGGRATLNWHDMVVVQDPLGNPDFRLAEALSTQLRDRGIDTVHLSMSHDAGIASAFVVLERSGDIRSSLAHPDRTPPTPHNSFQEVPAETERYSGENADE